MKQIAMIIMLCCVLISFEVPAQPNYKLQLMDSKTIAQFERKMWQAYYQHNYPHLYRTLLQFFSHQLNASFYDGLILSYNATLAAKFFSDSPENMP